MAKYEPFTPVSLKNRTWPSNIITHPPVWCSVDLRDGNQALPIPMSVEQKLEFFDVLVETGFKEIEIGFPSSNDTEFEFVRRLIDEKRIPEDVTIQVLCQAREPLIIKTLQAVKGAGNVIFHLYNAISPCHRTFNFNATKEELIDLAVSGVELLQRYIDMGIAGSDTNIRLEYSPEDFTGAETDYAIEICSAVARAWKPEAANPMILNLPATVEHSPANQFADQIEYFITEFDAVNDNAIASGKILVSLHNHNDRGTAVACAELGLLAGAHRIEGTLFGNGERTGNLDLVTLALNLTTQGVDTGLDFSHLPQLASKYSHLTGMSIPPRQPYAGQLVFTAFSGSHQDAIRKALSARAKGSPDQVWDIPYLVIDPRDLGREYEEIIRINSQSGKGGTAWILESEYGLILPKHMQPGVGAAVKQAADQLQRELTAAEVFGVFQKGWVNTETELSILDLAETHVDGANSFDNVLCRASVQWKGQIFAIGGKGNGPLAAFAAALGQTTVPRFSVTDFHEHSVGLGSDTDAFAYVECTFENGEVHWGCGKSSNIGRAGINAVVSAINRLRIARK